MRRISSLALPALLLLALPVQATLQDDYIDKMEREHAEDYPVASPVAAEAPATEVSGSMVTYAQLDETPVRGYLARPAGAQPTAGILLIHEWWGLNDNIRAIADRLAGEGYLALAVDLYEGEVADDRETAGRLARGSSEKRGRLEENLHQAYSYLASEFGAERVGVIGWCFGGGWSLRAALSMGDRISAAVIYYGRLETDPAELKRLRAPVLGIFGGSDQGIPVATVREFEAALESLDHEAAIHIYPEADHAFANPSGTRYNEAAATDAWKKTLSFFGEHLQ
jgi:carboxymethylenebutenolidase